MSRIYLHGLRRYKPSVIHTWQQLAQHDDIKNVKDDGQGHALGVKPGWRITETDGIPDNVRLDALHIDPELYQNMSAARAD